jgi:octaprenyl-diphosphate synthase
LPVIIAYESGDAMEKSFWQRTIEEGVATDADLEQATTLIAKYNTIAQTMDYAREHLEQALIALNTINGEANATEALQSTLAFCLSRRN